MTSRRTRRGVAMRLAYVPSMPRIPRGHDPIVYYARLDRLVKIGVTTNITRRIVTLPIEGVMALEPGSFDLEAERHRQFSHIRHSGEWFHLTEELATHIVNLREVFVIKQGVTVEEWLRRLLPRSKRVNDTS